ncbi:Succinate-semialdehyde dehydrogenase [NADP(+)] GabD [Sinobacterium norvegicum]|uniref:Succinate-semialdehyde dehydrogenase [NADP(+)] GabD n=1 Tax=Sinobacterium norvegicum TaxID=1641715 RepID=A0ABM9ABK0_9GAMM|nr:NAD-dependent succinate-semialdehyde dehydrogenase [Sinobacterium norvegicum]CAH0990577.1 Succinate-semialdehyde dehydrogenase [NADP(+)] GabD [Sinobacterium norvegicum]
MPSTNPLQLNDASLFRTDNYVNGQWLEADSRFEVLNPATGECIAAVANANADQMKQAIDSASKAFKQWRKNTAKQRSAVLKKWFALITENAEDLAKIMTAEQGKPLSEAVGEIHYGASYIEWFAEQCKRDYGDTIPTGDNSRRMQTIKTPVGVVGCVTPWNFPSAMITRKAAPALAAGCTVVIKPAAETPLSALALCVLAERAGIPAGAINVVVGTDSEALGVELTTDPAVAKFTFTGSTRVGKLLMAQCASTVKKVSMELGGNAPFIVFDDADIDQAVAGCIATKFRNAGQTCVCTNRIFVHHSIADIFTTKLQQQIEALTVGSGTDEVLMGPLYSDKAVANMDRLIADGVANGATVVTGGQRHALGQCFYQPTLMTGVTDTMHLGREEIFGPIAAVQTFTSDDEVIERANDTEYGLAAYYFTANVGRVFRLAEELEYGMVIANTGVFSSEVAPFGGVKQSGIGREGGHQGIEDFYDVKYHCIGLD